MILSCSCSHAFQDKEYGKGQRVHNLSVKVEGTKRTEKGWRCTVCGNVKPVGAKVANDRP